VIIALKEVITSIMHCNHTDKDLKIGGTFLVVDLVVDKGVVLAAGFEFHRVSNDCWTCNCM